jgi:prefoldin beta subunit
MSQEDIQQLQLLEQSVSNLVSQKQTFQVQLNEIDNAMNEIKDKETAFKIVGGLMVEKPKKDIEDELADKKKLLEVRISSLEKQESKMGEKKEALQKKVMESMKDDGAAKPSN